MRVSRALRRTLSSGPITGEAQPNVHFRKVWRLCRGWLREGTPGGRESRGRLLNVWSGLQQRGRTGGMDFREGTAETDGQSWPRHSQARPRTHLGLQSLKESLRVTGNLGEKVAIAPKAYDHPRLL